MKSAWMVPALAAMGTAQLAMAQVSQQLPPRVTVDTLSVVMVRNQRKVPVTVYLDYGPFDRRLGVVKALGNDTLRLPEYAVRGRLQVRLFAHPEGEVADLATQALALRAPARRVLVIPELGKMPPCPRAHDDGRAPAGGGAAPPSSLPPPPPVAADFAADEPISSRIPPSTLGPAPHRASERVRQPPALADRRHRSHSERPAGSAFCT